MGTYGETRERLETYFDRTAADTWARLTSDAPVSKIRQTVRAGRDAMRAAMMATLPDDLTGRRILDAGAGAGQMTIELAERGADVVSTDISPSLLDVAKRRTPDHLLPRIRFVAGDMLDPYLGAFDHVMSMDSLIHYRADDIGVALAGLAERTSRSVVFTIAPSTMFLKAFWAMGQVFPRSDRSPQIIPHSDRRIAGEVARHDVLAPFALKRIERVASGFYISQAMELSK
ncbi:MAG: magnesium protoporphyrin IX methyltransferase [Pseudomonadota bacterium]